MCVSQYCIVQLVLWSFSVVLHFEHKITIAAPFLNILSTLDPVKPFSDTAQGFNNSQVSSHLGIVQLL